MKNKIKVTVWNENRHETHDGIIRKKRAGDDACRMHYPQGMHAAIKAALDLDGSFEVECAWLDKDDEHGLSEEVLANTDVLFWWGHCAHGEVKDEVVDRIQKRVLEGMGLVVIHSGHKSKIFMRLMGTSCDLLYRVAGEKERVWVVEKAHPIAEGLPAYFELPHTEMYGERFEIPAPKDTVFISWYEGGEVFRSGLTFERGYGRIFYFAPGHEAYPIFHDKNVQRVLCNAAKWCAPRYRSSYGCKCMEPLEELKSRGE